MLVAQGHESWTAGAAGLAREQDQELAIYAHDKRAAVVTHDIEFSKWRRRRLFGQHIWLRCDEPDALDVLRRALPRIVPNLERGKDVWIRLNLSGDAEIYFKGWE